MREATQQDDAWHSTQQLITAYFRNRLIRGKVHIFKTDIRMFEQRLPGQTEKMETVRETNKRLAKNRKGLSHLAGTSSHAQK